MSESHRKEFKESVKFYETENENCSYIEDVDLESIHNCVVTDNKMGMRKYGTCIDFGLIPKDAEYIISKRRKSENNILSDSKDKNGKESVKRSTVIERLSIERKQESEKELQNNSTKERAIQEEMCRIKEVNRLKESARICQENRMMEALERNREKSDVGKWSRGRGSVSLHENEENKMRREKNRKECVAQVMYEMNVLYHNDINSKRTISSIGITTEHDNYSRNISDFSSDHFVADIDAISDISEDEESERDLVQRIRNRKSLNELNRQDAHRNEEFRKDNDRKMFLEIEYLIQLDAEKENLIRNEMHEIDDSKRKEKAIHLGWTDNDELKISQLQLDPRVEGKELIDLRLEEDRKKREKIFLESEAEKHGEFKKFMKNMTERNSLILSELENKMIVLRKTQLEKENRNRKKESKRLKNNFKDMNENIADEKNNKLLRKSFLESIAHTKYEKVGNIKTENGKRKKTEMKCLKLIAQEKVKNDKLTKKNLLKVERIKELERKLEAKSENARFSKIPIMNNKIEGIFGKFKRSVSV